MGDGHSYSPKALHSWLNWMTHANGTGRTFIMFPASEACASEIAPRAA